MAERRNATRHKSLLRGCIYFNHRRSATDCLIRDISESGARLVFSAAVAIPDVVDLYIPQKEQTLRARVQWRHGEEVGVAFEELPQVPEEVAAAPDAGDVVARLQKLEADVAFLRRMLKRVQAAVPVGSADAA
jgi:hypothetical protein